MKNLLYIFIFTCFQHALSASEVYAVIVGVEEYSIQEKLKYAVDDAELFYLCINGLKKNDGKVVILKDSKATKANIYKAINRLARKIKEDDVFIFYFAGHGLNGYIATYDADDSFPFISPILLKEKLKSIKSKNKLLFLDACNTGSFLLDSEKASDALINHYKTKGIGNHRNELENENIAVFVSTDVGESSYELHRFGHGAFTYYLCKGMLGKADYNADNNIDISELYYFVRNNTFLLSKQFESGTQCPILFGNFNKNLIISQKI